MLSSLKRIIVVSGVGNSGKSTAIKLAADKIGISVGDAMSGAHPARGDILVAVCTQLGRAKFGIGIASGGDSRAIVQQNIGFFREISQQLAVLVMACKSYGGSTEAVRSFATDVGLEPQWIRTERCEPENVDAECKKLAVAIAESINAL